MSFSQTRTVHYAESALIFPNPERGFFTFKGTATDRGPVTPYEPLKVADLREIRLRNSLIFRGFGLKEWRTTELPTSILQLIQNDFDAMRAAGVKCVLRFSYSNDMSEPDAPLSVVLRHIEQLKPLLHTNKDVIAAIQAGFLGAWGEWHSSSHGLDSTIHQRRVLLKILDALPADRMVQIRRPRFKREILNLPRSASSAVSPGQAHTSSSVARVGHHNDCFLSDDSDHGTYWYNGVVDTAFEKSYLRLDTRYVPLGGETCEAGPFSGCANALGEMARLRWSFLNEGHSREVLNGFVQGGCMNEIMRRLGYRFVLGTSEFSSSVQKGGTFRIRMSIANVGWAALFNRRDVQVLVRNNRNRSVYAVTLPVDPRFWLGGESVSISAEIGVPTFLASGHYSVLLNLPDPEPTLRGRPEYSIRLANDGVWEYEEGFNNLLDSVFVEPSPAGDPHNGSLWFEPSGSTSKGSMDFRLDQNFPNPFNSLTSIRFSLASDSYVTLKVYTILGEELTQLVNGVTPSSSGLHHALFDGSRFASGVYFYRMTARPLNDLQGREFVATQKLCLLK